MPRGGGKKPDACCNLAEACVFRCTVADAILTGNEDHGSRGIVRPMHGVVSRTARHHAMRQMQVIGDLCEALGEGGVHVCGSLLADERDFAGDAAPKFDSFDASADGQFNIIPSLRGSAAQVDAEPHFARDDVHDVGADFDDADRANDGCVRCRAGFLLDGEDDFRRCTRGVSS